MEAKHKYLDVRVVMRLRKKNLNNADVTLQMGGKQLFVLVLLGSMIWEKSVMGIAEGKSTQCTWQCEFMFSSGTGTEPVFTVNSGRAKIMFVLLHQRDVISKLIILTDFGKVVDLSN